MSTTLDRKKATINRGERDVRLGTVISDKGDKTIRVRYDFMVKHDKYGKYYRRSTILAAHDEKNEARTDDVVEVVSCRRVSKSKCWRLLRVVEQRSADQVVAVQI
jgi:small subunit ribosomal protein S17